MRVLVNDVPSRPHANAGQVLDLPDAEAQDMIRRGTAVEVSGEPPAELPEEPTPEPEPVELAAAPAVKKRKTPRTKKPRG